VNKPAEIFWTLPKRSAKDLVDLVHPWKSRGEVQGIVYARGLIEHRDTRNSGRETLYSSEVGTEKGQGSRATRKVGIFSTRQ